MVKRYVQSVLVDKKALLLYNLLIDTIGWTLILPALPGLYASFEADTATIGTLTSLLSLLTFMCGTVQGIASDYFGRIRMLQMCALSQFFGHLLTIYGLRSQSFCIFVLSRCLPALFKCCMVVSQAYLFDIEEHLPGNSDVATLYAYSNIAFMTGPLLGGFLVSYSVYYPCVFGLIISVIEMTILYFLEEIAHSETRQHIQRQNTQQYITSQEYETDIDDYGNGKAKATDNSTLIRLLHIKFAYQLGNALFESLFPQYGRSSFGLSGYATGLCYSLTGVLSALVNMYILPAVLQLRGPEQYLMCILACTWAGLMIWAWWSTLVGLLLGLVVVTVAGNIFLGILQNAIVVCMKSPDSRIVGNTSSTDYGAYDDIEGKAVGNVYEQTEASHAVLAYAQSSISKVYGNNKWVARLDRVRTIVVMYLSQCICVVLPSIGIGLSSQSPGHQDDNNKNSKSSKGGTSNGAGAVFGISATADRAARVIAPLIGGMLIQHYGSAGLAGLGCASVLYCLALLVWKVPQQANILNIPVTYSHSKTM